MNKDNSPVILKEDLPGPVFSMLIQQRTSINEQ